MLIHCCILLDFLCELYYDARIYAHQIGADVFETAILASTGIHFVQFSTICCNTKHLNKSPHPSLSLFFLSANVFPHYYKKLPI